MKAFNVVAVFYQGDKGKALYESKWLIMEETKEKAKAYVHNFLTMQNFFNFSIKEVIEIKND